MFSLTTFAHSEVGRIRKNNQDAAYASPTMMVVCDGMGGAAAGDLASAAAIFEAQRADRRVSDPEEMLSLVALTMAQANDKLADLISQDLSIDGMGTTFCGVLFNGEHLVLGHIGDSRGYRLREGMLEQLTHDHSWVQTLIDEGRLTPEQAATHPHRSLVLKVLNGRKEGMQPDLAILDVELGDRYLFCSDGLSGLVSAEDIRDALDTMSLEEAVTHLAAEANAHGGHDNITIVVGEIVEQNDELDSLPGQIFGSATEVEVPAEEDQVLHGSDADSCPELVPEQKLAAEEDSVQESERYALHEERRRWPGLLIALIILALSLGAGAWGLQAYARSQYYVSNENGNIAIFNGIPGSLLGMPLSTVVDETSISVSDLPRFQQRAVNNTIAVADLEAGRATTRQLEELAKQCRATRLQRLARTQGTQSPSQTPSEASTKEERGYPTYLATMSPTASEEADAGSC